MSKKTIWITGGSTGIGKALAIKFASKGWNVAVSDRREELLNELSNTCENISAFPLDVTDKLKCQEVFNQIKNKFQDIDICFFSIRTFRLFMSISILPYIKVPSVFDLERILIPDRTRASSSFIEYGFKT